MSAFDAKATARLLAEADVLQHHLGPFIPLFSSDPHIVERQASHVPGVKPRRW